MSIWQDINPINVFSGGEEDISNVVSDVGDVFTAPAQAVQSVGDFLSFIAWIFDPLNILRAVEFVTGLFLMGYGTHMMTTGSGEVPGAKEAALATPVGRAVEAAGARRQGAQGARRQIRGAELETERRRGASTAVRKSVGKTSRRQERTNVKETKRVRTEKFGYKQAAREVGYEPPKPKSSRQRRRPQ